MDSIRRLSLIPNNNTKSSFTVALLKHDDQKGLVESNLLFAQKEECVFQDFSYRFEFFYGDLQSVQEVSLFINDDYTPCDFNKNNDNGSIEITFFKDNNRVFLDCYGYVQISLQLLLADNSVQEFYTPYIPVLVKRGELNDSIWEMVKYVDANQSVLLHYDKQKARDYADIKENGVKSLETQIRLAINIANLFEKLYGYFRINSRVRIEKVPIVDRIEKLQTINPKTIEYIASHPEQLKTIIGINGVQIGNRYYEPKKTMVFESVFSKDLYENRVILGFLKMMLNAVEQLRKLCNVLLDGLPENEEYDGNYVNSSFYMCCLTIKRIQDNAVLLKKLEERFRNMWNLYQDILRIVPEELNTAPRPTAVFLTIPQYNQVFVSIQEWIRYGVYDFSSERYMLSLIKISSLYEVYLLIKLSKYLQDRGFTLNDIKKSNYPVSQNWAYKNTSIYNTYCFVRNQIELTVYYQPVVFDYCKQRNGIGLYRNNSIPIKAEYSEGAHYYNPDYILKLSADGKNKYLILDAKFSSFMTIRKHLIHTLAFKYLFSVSTVEDNDSYLGFCILYGKCSQGEPLRTAYDKELPNRPTYPLAELLPLIEGVDTEEHYFKLDELLQKLNL